MPRINSTFTSRIRSPRGDTLLDYLARRFEYHTRGEWSDLLALGRLELEGVPARADSPLREGQRLLFHVVDYDEPDVPVDFAFLPPAAPGAFAAAPSARADGSAVGTDDSADGPGRRLAFVHKPAGLPVHRTGKIFFNTLANLVKERLGDGAWAPLNRLDRETSGIVAFARGPEAFRTLAPDGGGARWAKAYAAVIRGVLPEAGIGRIDQPLGELPGDPIRSRMHVRPGGKRSVSLYRTVAVRDGCSLVALSPVTGRKHQLRAHLAWAGCPVIGDKMYSAGGAAYLARLERELGEADYRALGARRQQLHACWLRISPADGEPAESLDLGAGSLEHAAYSERDFRDWWTGPEGRRFREAADAERAGIREASREAGTGPGAG